MSQQLLPTMEELPKMEHRAVTATAYQTNMLRRKSSVESVQGASFGMASSRHLNQDSVRDVREHEIIFFPFKPKVVIETSDEVSIIKT